MRIKIKLNDDAALPNQGTEGSTGYDVIAVSEPVIVGDLIETTKVGRRYGRISYIEYDTGIQVLPENEEIYLTQTPTKWGEPLELWKKGRRLGYLEAFPRSSISKTNLILANSIGLIDNDYRGTIKLRFKYLWQPAEIMNNGYIDESYIYHKGDKIAQLVARWRETIDWKIVTSLDDTARGTGGFGSTDKPIGNHGSSL